MAIWTKRSGAKNNWKMTGFYPYDYEYSIGSDEYTFRHSVFDTNIGDEIESDMGDEFHSGIVVGVIRNKLGRPVCFKVYNWAVERDGQHFDYIPIDDVTLSEPCGDVAWSLGRIGYKKRGGHSRPTLYENKELKDVALYW